MPRRPRPTRFEPDRPSTAPPPRRRLGLGRFVVNLLLILIVTPLLVTACYRVVPPPATLLMLQRAGEDGVRKDWRPLERIDANLVHAVVAAEDSRFCSHRGFDMEAIRRAMAANEAGNGAVRGGSTISQQTAKNVFLWPQRSWVRKGMEAGFTVLIETIWGKRRIMEVYLNVAEFAPGVYGAEAAAQRWYGKSADNLTRTEAARLAAILPAPRRYKAASPGPYVRRRAGRISAAIQVVRDDGLSTCALDGVRPAERSEPEPPTSRRPHRPEANRDLLDAARNPEAASETPVGTPEPPVEPESPSVGGVDTLDEFIQPVPDDAVPPPISDAPPDAGTDAAPPVVERTPQP